MKKICLLFLTITMLFAEKNLYAQNDSSANITIYRMAENYMSGGGSLSIKILFNDQVVTTLQTNTKLNYKLYSTGTVKVKMVAEFSGNPIGSPFVKTIDFEKGTDYHISVEAGSMFGVKAELLDEKGLKKVNKYEFADSISLEEDKK